MSDKHLYDEHGNYKGRISDTPPSDASSDDSSWGFGSVVALAILGAILGTIGGCALIKDPFAPGAGEIQNRGAEIGALLFGLVGLVLWIRDKK